MDSSAKCVPISEEMDHNSDDLYQSIEMSSAVSVSLCSEHEDREYRKDLHDSLKFRKTITCAWVASMANYQNAFDFNDLRSFAMVNIFSDYKNDHTLDQSDNNMDEENGSMEAGDTKTDDLDSTNKDTLDQNMLEYSDDSIIFTDDPTALTFKDDCEFDYAEVMTEDSIISGYSIISSRGSLKNLSDEDFLNEEYDLNASFDEISKIEHKEKVLAFESLFFEPRPIDEKLKKLNDAWNFDMKDSRSSPRQSMKVSFDLDLTTVYSYEKPCEDDYDSWILDMMRFKRRIDEFEYMMNPFLTAEHRSNVLLRNLSLGGI